MDKLELRPSEVLREYWDSVLVIEEDAQWLPTEYINGLDN